MAGKFEQILIKDLILDTNNPRLPEDINRHNEKVVINWMLESSTLLDLMGSISQNGFFEGEPIIVWLNEGKNIVIEGNRRVAAVKLLLDPEIATTSESIVSKLSEEAKNKKNIPERLRVYQVTERDKIIDNYLGFRHVSGVKPWPVIAKARYLHGLLDAHPNKGSASVFKDLAKEVGSKSTYVKRLLYGYELYNIIRKNNWFGMDLDEESFDISLITDAATMHSAISEYMGIDYDDPVNPFKNLNKDRLKEISKIIYDKVIIKPAGGKTTRLGDNRKLRVLNKVLLNDKAKEVFLVENKSLEEAAEYAGISEETLRNYLSKAKNFISEAQSIVQKVTSISDSDLSDIKEIIESSYIIEQTLTRKKVERKNRV